MKYRFIGIAVFVGMMAMFAVTANAQIVGGYKAIAADDAGAQAAAEFAVSAEAAKSKALATVPNMWRADFRRVCP